METSVILTCILSSTVAAAFITGIKEVVIWKLNRNATVSDKKDDIDEKIEKLSEEVASLEETVSKMQKYVYDELESAKKCDKVILQDRIRHLALNHIRAKKISYEDRKIIHDMWKVYHFERGGNGDLDPILKELDELPLDL